MEEPTIAELTRRVVRLEEKIDDREKDRLEEIKQQTEFRTRLGLVWGGVLFIVVAASTKIWELLKVLWQPD